LPRFDGPVLISDMRILGPPLTPAPNVSIWHETHMPKYLGDVRCWVNSGKHMLALSFSGFDPSETSNPIASEALGAISLPLAGAKC
jgi:hypothetical protein